MDNIAREILELENLCVRLGIPEYTEHLTKSELCCLAIVRLGVWLIENRDEIYQNIHEGE